MCVCVCVCVCVRVYMCTPPKQYFKVSTAWHGGLETFFILRILFSEGSCCRTQCVRQMGPCAPPLPFSRTQLPCRLCIQMADKNYVLKLFFWHPLM